MSAGRLAAEFGTGLQAAFLLARGRSDGVERIDGTSTIETRLVLGSFWSMLLCLPPFLVLHVLDWRQLGVPAHPAREIAVELAAFVVDWLAFAVLSHQLAGRVGRAAAWPRFLVVWNCCNLVQYLLLLVASVPGWIGAPDWLSQTTWLAATGWALWIEWFATRTTLGVPGAAAAAITAFDVALGFLVFALSGVIGSY